MNKEKIIIIVLGTLFLICGIFSLYATYLYENLETDFNLLKQKNEELILENDNIKTEKVSLEKDLKEILEEKNNLEKKISEQETIINNLKASQTKQTNTAIPINEKVAYLTFDDGPSQNTIKILDVLKSENIKATFFINGNYNKDIVNRIISEGHSIGNHTYSHSYKNIYSSQEAFWKDIDKLNNQLKQDFNYIPEIIRFPGGSNNTVSYNYGGKEIMSKIINDTNNKGISYFDWNVSSQDATGKKISSNDIVKNVVNGSKNKNHPIILMHDAGAKQTTAEAVPEIIKELKALGFSFDKLTKDSPTVHFK